MSLAAQAVEAFATLAAEVARSLGEVTERFKIEASRAKETIDELAAGVRK